MQWFTDGGCTQPLTSHKVETLVRSGRRDLDRRCDRLPAGAAGGGHYSFQANYLGDGNTPSQFAPSMGPCEPLTVVDAYIQITPQNAANAVGTNHTLTITVNATDGGILASGTATASILTPPSTTGSFVGSPSCNYTGGAATASCTVTITSAACGLTQVQAISTIGFNNATGTVTRTTGTADNMTAGCTVNCGNAAKNWVDAYIQITPQTAANAVGTNHVLTITVTATGGGVLASGTATASILTPPSTTGSFVGSPTCNYAGGAATASCTVTITSAVAGITSVQASSTIGFTNAAGTVTRTTGTADNVTAGCTRLRQRDEELGRMRTSRSRRRTPPTRSGTNHVLTITVNATGGGVLAAGTATASIITPPSTTGSFVGSPRCNYAGGAASATCTVHDHLRGGRVDAGAGDFERRLHERGGHGEPHDGDGRQRDGGLYGELREREQDVGGCVYPDHAAERDERGGYESRADDHGQATNGGVLAAGTATASILTPPSTTGSFVGSPTCNYAGGAATATCTVTITSAVSGLTQVQATSSVGFTNAVGTVTRTTGTADNVTAGCTVNCGNAEKNWVDAYIQITPQNAANAVGTNHVLTITVNATNGGVLARRDGDGEHPHAAEHDRQLRRLPLV